MEYPTQATCPYCLSAQGYVRRVLFRAHERMFTYTCEDCHRMWTGEPHAYESIGDEPLDRPKRLNLHMVQPRSRKPLSAGR